MGGGNSPAIACLGGQAFLHLVCKSCHMFRGEASANCWWTGFLLKYKGYDPLKGYGYVLTNRDGIVAKVWGFVDDFLIHALTEHLCNKAKLFFIDVAHCLGFLYCPLKCTTPSQVVKFIGFEFDTAHFPVP